jgi:hypothetical protein
MGTMASITKNNSGNWKATIGRKGWPPSIKTFRAKRDADNWTRTTEDKIVRGILIRPMVSERTTVDEALARYLTEISPCKRAHSRTRASQIHAKPKLCASTWARTASQR